jgi:putative transposase
MDNGPEFNCSAEALLLRQCLTGVVQQEWLHHSYIPPRSPWENSFVESFYSRFRDEFLNNELFTSVQKAKLLAEQHRLEHNTYRAHSALQGHTPLEAIQEWKAA